MNTRPSVRRRTDARSGQDYLADTGRGSTPPDPNDPSLQGRSTMSKRDIYVDKMETQLDGIKARMDRLAARDRGE